MDPNYFDLISPPDEIGLLLFAFNPCLEDGIRAFLVQLAIPCMPSAMIFVLQIRDIFAKMSTLNILAS